MGYCGMAGIGCGDARRPRHAALRSSRGHRRRWEFAAVGVVTVAVVLSTCAARHPDPQHPTLHTHTFPGNVLVQNPPTGTIFAADRPDTLQVTPVDEETWPVQYKSLRRNDVELGAHSVLYDAIEVNVTRGVTNFTVGPFHAPDIISDRPKAQDDVIFDNQILARMPPAHDRRPVYVREFRVRFVDMDGNPWPDIPMWLRQFQFVKVHNATMFCRRSEFPVVDLEPFDDYTNILPAPYGLLIHDPAAPPHDWGLRIEIEDGRAAIGEQFPQGEINFQLEFSLEWTEELHYNTHRVLLDALGCPSVLSQQNMPMG